MTSRFVNPIIKYTTATLKTMPGAELYFYITGTTTPKTTYQDFEGAIPHANPVVALSDGHFPPIFLDGSYRAELKYLGITQPGWPVDDIGATDAPAPLADWNSGFSYSSGDLVTGPDGNRYQSLQDNNLGNDPASSPLYWSQVFLGGNVDSWEQLDNAARSGPGPKADAESAIRYSLDLPESSQISFVQGQADGSYLNRTPSQVKGDIGLSDVDNTSDADKPVSTAQQTALNLKANIASPVFTGNPQAPTPAANDNDTSIATTAFVQANRLFDNGTVANPSISFKNDDDTGFFRQAANAIGVVTGGALKAIFTALGRLGVGTDTPRAVIHATVNSNADGTCGIRSTAYWSGTTATPYQNNDCTLFEINNEALSNSTNYSWASSCANQSNNIPLGVTDLGFRKGVYGWAVSVSTVPGYTHSGTLALQIGAQGLAGFLGPGTPSTAVVTEAIGVRGEINNDSVGATIGTATAGEFLSVSSVGEVNTNYAVRAIALNGNTSNWSFHGDAGNFFNQDKSFFGSKYIDSAFSDSKVAARGLGNSFEWGFAGTGGYGSALGTRPVSGDPYISFCAAGNSVNDNFQTAGQYGFVIFNQLNADSLVFSRFTNPNASGQSPSESFRIDANNRVQFQGTPIIPAFSPASGGAAGQTGQISWDGNYIYICVATNTWRRVATASF